MKLIKMTDFVLEQKVSHTQIIKYAKFLKQPLTLGMFVPCDEDGNVLEEPIDDSDRGRCEYDLLKKLTFKEKSEKYQQAKERVLFEGCFINFKGEVIVKETDFQTLKYADSNWIIEDLIQFDLTLTQSVIKNIGL